MLRPFQILLSVSVLIVGCQSAPRYASVPEAIKCRDTTRLRQILDADPRLSRRRQPLNVAASENSVAAARLLIERGADVNARGSGQDHALFPAARSGAAGVVRLLLAHGANVNATDSFGSTPLHAAAGSGHDGIVRLLLQAGANPLARDTNMDESALDRAVKGGHATTAALLLAAGASATATNAGPNSVLHLAVRNGDFATVALLLAHGANPNGRGGNGAAPLHLAAVNDRRALARLLIAKGADVNARDADRLTPLHWAATAESRATVRYLLAQGAEDDIWSAAILGHTRRVRQLLQRSPSLANASDGLGLTALHRAAEAGHQAIVEVLLAAGAGINAMSYASATPLTCAAAAGHYALVEYLVAKGANPRGTGDWTPLHAAASHGRTDTIQLLLRHGAAVNAAPSAGITPLHVAAKSGHAQATALLLRHGANVNARQDDAGQTPLHLAVARHHRWNRTVEVLLRAGADARVQTTGLHAGITPLQKAVNNDDQHSLQLMLTVGQHLRISDPELRDALFEARNHPGIALWLLRAGVPVNSTNKWMLLAHAYPQPDPRIANWLWRSGLDPNCTVGIPLLVHAVIYGNRDLMQMLLRRGANPNQKTEGGDTALGSAIRTDFCEFDAAEWLVDIGTDVNAPSQVFGYPLAQAAGAARPKLVAQLLACGANVRAADIDGRTALHRAVFRTDDPVTRNLQRQVVQLLLAAGADTQAKDKQGQTALDLANKCGKLELAVLLQQPSPPPP